MKIYPSVMAKSQKELSLIFSKLRLISKEFHLDIADGKFVPNTSLWFPFRLSPKFRYNAHLMIKDPIKWIEKNSQKVDAIIFHPEAVQDVNFVINKIKNKKKKVGLALKPETNVSKIKQYLRSVNKVLILTVHPGFYGAKFLLESLSKIREIKKINPKIEVIVDGGMNPATVRYVRGADSIVCGSYLQKAEDIRKAMKELRKASL